MYGRAVSEVLQRGYDLVARWESLELDTFLQQLIKTKLHRGSELLRKVVFPVPFLAPKALDGTVSATRAGACRGEWGKGKEKTGTGH